MDEHDRRLRIDDRTFNVSFGTLLTWIAQFTAAAFIVSLVFWIVFAILWVVFLAALVGATA